MNDYFARLNPLERRIVIFTAVILCLVVHFVFVSPRFKEWGDLKNRKGKAEDTLFKFDRELAQAATIEKEIRELENAGASVPQDDQTVDFIRNVQSQAVMSGINLLNITRQPAKTNQFFVEQTQNVNVQGGEKELVDFLYDLGSASSMIRVRDLNLRPDGTRQKLAGSIRLVASYQKNVKKPEPRAAAPTAPGVASTATPNVKRP